MRLLLKSIEKKNLKKKIVIEYNILKDCDHIFLNNQ